MHNYSSSFIQISFVLMIFLNIDKDTLLKKLFKKLIIRLKMLYDTRKNFIVLKDVKKYLLKLNNN